MQMKSYILVVFLLEMSTVYGDNCTAIHANAHGINLICCSLSSPLISSCEYGSLCRDEECNCHLIVGDQLNCTLGSDMPFEWKDHASHPLPVSCSHLHLPMEHSYNMKIEHWRENYTTALIWGLNTINVTRLTLLEHGDDFHNIDFSKSFPNLQILEISLRKPSELDVYDAIRHLKQLTSLRLTNVNFEFGHGTPSWINTIRYIHVENSSMTELPKWLSKSRQLDRIVIKGTRLRSIATVSQMQHLKSAQLSHNLIDDLRKHVLISKELYDIDLSYNKIASIASHSFSQCAELRILDLSGNPIEHLPYKPFLKNSKLKWLKLSRTKLQTLTPEHFIGLTALKSLTLSHSPIHTVSPFSFLPLKSLKTLDMEYTNITRIPNDVTQSCYLTHLNLANNFLHRRSSLPSEVLALLSSLTQFRIDGNPLQEFPPSLLLISTDNIRLIKDLVNSMTSLPVWTSDPCTPYYWNMHLRNKSSTLRHFVANWGEEKMKQNGLEYCREQYEWMAEQIDIYRDLERNSGCSVNRRLRSAVHAQKSESKVQCEPPANHSVSFNAVSSGGRLSVSNKAVLNPEPKTLSNLLILSLVANLFFICMTLSCACIIWFCGKTS